MHEDNNYLSDLTESSMNMGDESSGDEFLSTVLGKDANGDSDDDGGGKPAASLVTETPLDLGKIKSIWEDDMIIVDRGKNKWTCLWCKCSFSINATKAVAHLLKTKSDVQKCVAKMDDLHFKRYTDMQASLVQKCTSKKRSSDTMQATIGQHNDIVANKLNKRKEAWRSGTIHNSSFEVSSLLHLNNGGSVGVSGSSSNTHTSDIT